MSNGPTLATMQSLLMRLQDEPEAIPWPERRDIPRSLVMLLSGRPTQAQTDAAGHLLKLLAGDPKWEVRKAVADALRYAPEETFAKTLARLSDDENTFVRRAAENALERRRRASGSARRRPGVPRVAERLAALERVHGPDAAKAARVVGEAYYDQLVGEITHDVRSILTPLVSGLKRLVQQVEKGTFQQGRPKRSLQQMRDRVELLHRLVEDMRSYSNPVPRKRRSERLADILSEAQRLARDELEERGARLDDISISAHLDESVTVQAARDQLLMALVNIVKNAFQSFPRDGSVEQARIDIQMRATDSGEAQIVVRDNGIGIEPEDLEQLREFLPGRKTKKNDGTGFGLPIARRIIDAHGGRLTIESKVDVGTIVTVTLPLDQGGSES